MSLSLLIILFSLAGIPPLAGFFAKFYVFKAVIEQSMYFLAIVGLLSTVIAAFYYLRIIKIIYFDKEKEKYDSDHGLWLKFSLTFSTILILLYFIFPSLLIVLFSIFIFIYCFSIFFFFQNLYLPSIPLFESSKQHFVTMVC